jgi:hypothetical protein
MSTNGKRRQKTLQIYGKLLDNITSQREASYRDMVQDLIVGLERSSELDRAIEQLHDKFREKRERAIDEAHEFSGKLVTAFDTERNKLVQLYRMQCGRNTELRHHLHRGTHNSRPTQLTDKERKTLTQQKDLSEAVNKLRAELDSVTQELHELDRRVEATMQKSEVSDDAFVRGRDQKHADGRECQGLMVALQREQEQWRNAKNDLELLLRYVKVGGIPDSAAQPRWRLAVMAARRASSMKTSCATSMVGADDGAHARHHEVLSGTQTPQQQPEPSAAHDAAPAPAGAAGATDADARHREQHNSPAESSGSPMLPPNPQHATGGGNGTSGGSDSTLLPPRTPADAGEVTARPASETAPPANAPAAKASSTSGTNSPPGSTPPAQQLAAAAAPTDVPTAAASTSPAAPPAA